MLNCIIDFISSKSSIVILGFGKEGRSSYKFIRKYLPNIQLCIADQNSQLKYDNSIKDDPNTEIILGKNYQDKLYGFELIIKSPGIELIEADDKIEARISSQTDLFLMGFRDQTIGVTGTKGKSTTVSLIKHLLDNTGKNSFLLGNIGVPALEMADKISRKDIVVYELSAHQLEYVRFSPHIAVLLNIFPEHLDYFDSLENYKKAKFNIFKYQNDSDFLMVSEQISESLPQVSSIIEVIDKVGIYDDTSFPLLGRHNLLNGEFAISAATKIGINRKDAQSVITSFEPLPHRLEVLGRHGGVNFINDSISTVPESTVAAINSVGKVDILILGGFDRGLDYSELSKFILHSEINKLIFLGDAGRRMKSLINVTSKKQSYFVDDLEQAFDIIDEMANEGDVCLLSPAAASYDQFKNFEHRGDMFRSLALKFRKK